MLVYWNKDKIVGYAYYLYMSQYRMLIYKSDDFVLNRLGFVYFSLKAKYESIKDSCISSGLSWPPAGSALALIVKFKDLSFRYWLFHLKYFMMWI